MNYIKGNKRLIPCEMAFSSFYLDPYDDVRACNVMEESMGNLRENSLEEIWNGNGATRVRQLVRNCHRDCWMIGSVGEIMKKHFTIPTKWIIKTKFLRHNI